MVSDDAVERMAQQIHANYLTAQRGSTLPPWENLTEDLREANRAQARAIADKLARVGASVQPGAGQPFAFTAVEVELLAREEHDRWVDQRRAAGWTYGEIRDDARKRHPQLVDWDSLSEAERAKDRSAVLHIPDVLAAAGLHARRG